MRKFHLLILRYDVRTKLKFHRESSATEASPRHKLKKRQDKLDRRMPCDPVDVRLVSIHAIILGSRYGGSSYGGSPLLYSSYGILILP